MKKFLLALLLTSAIILGSTQSGFAGERLFTSSHDYEFVEMTTGGIFLGIVCDDIDFLALRSGPSTSYPELTRIPPGEYVYVIRDGVDNFSPFRRVKYKGIFGYAHGAYITIVKTVHSFP